MYTLIRRLGLCICAATFVPACGGGGGSGGGGPTSPPGAFTATTPGNGATSVALQPTFMWTAATQAASYRFQLSSTTNFGSPLIDASGINGTSVTPSVSLANSTTYFWRVFAENSRGTTLATGSPFSFTTLAGGGGPPGAFAQSSPADGATGVSRLPTFTWTAASGATSYTLEVSTSVTFAPLTFQRTGILLTGIVSPQALDASTDYFWRVTAVNGSGNTLATGAPDTFQTNGPAPGGIDTSFDGDGRVTTHFGFGIDEARAVAVQPDGKIVAAGHAHNGTDLDMALARYNPDGSLDSTFDNDGLVTVAFGSANDEALAIAVQPDGKIVAAGYAVMAGPSLEFAVARFEPDGALDAGFGTGGRVTTPIASGTAVGRAIALQSDGKIIVAGNASVGMTAAFAVVRYGTDGTPDSSYDTDGIVTTLLPGGSAVAWAVAIQGDDKAVVAGQATSSLGTNLDSAVVRYTTGGAPDSAFDTDGIAVVPASVSMDDVLYAVAVQGDGNIVGAGYVHVSGSDRSLSLIRISTTGGFDNTFDTDGIVATPIDSREDEARGIALQADGKIVVAGIATQNSGNIDFGIARYTTSGALDGTFDLDGIVRMAVGTGNDEGYAVALTPDGRIVVVGYATISGGRDFALARLWP